MQEYEVNTIIDNLPYMDRNSWEQHRFLAYTNIQINSKKKLSPTDIMKFAWDSEEDVNTISKEEIERLRSKSKGIFNTINNNGK